MRKTMGRTMKRRGGDRQLLSIVILLIAVVLAAFMLIVLFRQIKKSQEQPVYEYVSMAEEASARAYIWLERIEDMPLSYADIRQMMGTLELELILTPTGEKGRYIQAPAEGSAADCIERAQEGLERAYRRVVAHRLAAAGYEGDISEEALDDLMREAYGVSVAEYLASCDVQLLPTAEELAEMYSGEVARE